MSYNLAHPSHLCQHGSLLFGSPLTRLEAVLTASDFYHI